LHTNAFRRLKKTLPSMPTGAGWRADGKRDKKGKGVRHLVEEAMMREEEAFFIFHKYDTNQDHRLDTMELHACLIELGYHNGRAQKTDAQVQEWLKREMKKGDTNRDGFLSFDEFVAYYNTFVAAYRQKFEDRYLIGQSIGEGAFATVFRAVKTADNTQVAVKKISKGGYDMALVHNEISVWEHCDHPNLLQMIDVFETPDELLLVSDLMRGGDLFQALAGVERFSELEARLIFEQIVSAVAHLHHHHVVHCDLKPSNILVVHPHVHGCPLQLKIADFGLSQTLTAASGAELKEVCGTPDYFAPELVAIAQGSAPGTGYGSGVDCWAVGCILYELLAGRPPFEAKTENVLFYKICDFEIEFNSEIFGAIDAGVTSLIKGLTMKDPTKRCSCAMALEDPWVRGITNANVDLPTETSRQRRRTAERRKTRELERWKNSDVGSRDRTVVESRSHSPVEEKV